MAIGWREFLEEACRRGLVEEGLRAELEVWFESVERAGQKLDPAGALIRRGIVTMEQAGQILAALGGKSRRSVRAAGETVERTGVLTAGIAASASTVESLVPGYSGVRLRGEPGLSGSQRTGKYLLGSELGRGGMGAVWLAQDEDIRREVAIKTMLEASDSSDVERFLVEAQVSGQLEHPNIVPVYELGVKPGDGLPYLVMKRIRGGSLDAVLERVRNGESTGLDRSPVAKAGDPSDGAEHTTRRRRRRPSAVRSAPGAPVESPERALSRLLEVFLKVCDAVAYAHARGVIHRDLKPANIMVGEFGEVHVMDWGLAKVVGRDDASPGRVRTGRADRPDSAIRTAQGAIVGTPAYMPPEQARGEVDRLDERSDVYSLGAVLYEILCLSRPFEGRDLRDLLGRVEKGRFDPPAERNAAAWTIPRELEAVVLKAMSRRPEDRYASAGALREDVEAYLSGRTLRAVEYSPWELLAKWVQRHRTAAIGTAATILALLGGLAAVSLAARRSREAEAARVRAERTEQAVVLFEAGAARRSGSTVAFDPATPQPYFLAHLPAAMSMGQAIQTHPEPPESWRQELAAYSGELQSRAEEAGDWALAEHLALSTEAWGALGPGEGEVRRRRSRDERLARAREDVARFERVLDEIARAEGDVRQGRLLPGEIQERARIVARLPSRQAVARAVLGRVALDNAALQEGLVRGTGAQGGLTTSQRVLCAEILGRLKDRRTEAVGATAPALAERTLLLSTGLGLHAQEVSAWVRTVSLLAAAAGPFEAQGVESLFELVEGEHDGVTAVVLALERARALVSFAVEGRPLPRFPDRPLRSVDPILEDLGDWLAATVQSGSDYTIHLLGSVGPGRRPLTIRQHLFVLDQLGLHGDAVTADASGRRAGEVLRAAVLEAPAEHLEDGALSGPAASSSRRDFLSALRGVLGLARLGDSGAAPRIWERVAALPEGSFFRRQIRLAAKFLPIAGWTPASAREYCLRALARRQVRGTAEEVMEDANRAIELEPDRAEAYLLRAEVYVARGDAERARADSDRAVSLAPDDAEIRIGRGSVRRNLGDQQGALEDYDEAIRRSPDESRAHNLRGCLRRDRQENEAALEDFDHAIRVDPESVPDLSNRALCRIRLGDLEGAVADCDRAIELDPSVAEAYLHRAVARAAGMDFDLAMADASRAIELDPHFAHAYSNRGEYRLETGDLAGAFEDVERAILLEPNLVEARWNLAKAFLHAGDRTRALEAYGRAIEVDPANGRSYYNRAVVRTEMGDLDGALADYDRAIERMPEFVSAWFNRGNLHRKRRDDPRAIADYDRAIALAPDRAEIHYNRGNARKSSGDLRGAIADYQRAAELDPSLWQARLNRAVVLAEAGDREGAARAFEEAIAFSPPEVRSRIESSRRKVLGE